VPLTCALAICASFRIFRICRRVIDRANPLPKGEHPSTSRELGGVHRSKNC
jgi:hypothetical protein